MLKSVIATLAVISILVVAPASADETQAMRTLAVTGHGEVRAVPDTAMVAIGVTSSAATAREALDANSKSMATLLDMLQKAGVEQRDITTSNFSVGPRFDYGSTPQQPKLLGYDVANTVTIVVRKLDDLGELLDMAVSSGSNQISGVTFAVSKPDAAFDEARKLALADARRKAEVYALAGGFKLGHILSISESADPGPPVVYATRAEAQVGNVPIARGEQALAVDVNLRYEIQ